MDTVTLPDQIAGGMDQRWFPATNKAQLVQNFRYEPSGGWRNDRGWEPLIPYPSPFNPSISEIQDLYQPCRFLTIVQRHQGAEEYYLQERNGNLFYEFGNQGTATTNKVILDTDRNLCRPDDPGTQAIPYGRFTAIINGYNKMLKWWGRSLVEQFSFYQKPPSPTPLTVQTDYNIDGVYPTTGGPIDNGLTGIAVQFDEDSRLGLGDPTGGAINTYSYRISYVTNTGSESPLSDSVSIGWDIPTVDVPGGATAAANQKKYAVMLVGLEPGPNGTVARRIYRTKNKKDGITGSGDNYFLVTQINDNNTTAYLDFAPDNQLVTAAPSLLDSTVISTGYKYGASWNGAFWLAGGEANPTKLIYSVQGFPEQFPAFNYFDVGVRDGGHITALYPYYDVLLVFRERSIDAVFTNAAGDGFTCTTIRKDIGTTATNTIKLIPGYGVMFLNKDGFWLIKGGLRGGAQLDIEGMSAVIEKEMGRLSKNALARASASYSDREKEYWCIYPVDGETECTRGASWNIVNESWSLRNGEGEPPLRQWKFSQIATDQSGYFIIGTRPQYNISFPLLSDAYPGLGLQVWSGRRSYGDTATITVSPQGVYTITPASYTDVDSVWTSTWYDFGDDSVKKRILSVELDVLTEGSNGIELRWAQDWGYDYNSAGTVVPQIGEVKGTTGEQPTYQTPGGLPVAGAGNGAVWNTSKWQDPRVTRMRWDVQTGLVSHFQFQLVTTNRIQIVRYQINFIGGQVKTPNTRAPGAF